MKAARFYRKNVELDKGALVEAGDIGIWQWHNWEPAESCEMLKANGKDWLGFTFGDKSKVSVKLEQLEDSVMIVLKQYDMPTDEKTKLEVHVGCSNGWTFWLTNLKAFLEHGIVLNDEGDCEFLANLWRDGNLLIFNLINVKPGCSAAELKSCLNSFEIFENNYWVKEKQPNTSSMPLGRSFW